MLFYRYHFFKGIFLNRSEIPHREKKRSEIGVDNFLIINQNNYKSKNVFDIILKIYVHITLHVTAEIKSIIWSTLWIDFAVF